MFDAAYFREGLATQVADAGAGATVEVHLVNGQAHRVRSVIHVDHGYVALEVYQRRPEMTGGQSAWQGHMRTPAAAAPNEVHRAVISYESITQVVITPADDKAGGRIGFSAKV